MGPHWDQCAVRTITVQPMAAPTAPTCPRPSRPPPPSVPSSGAVSGARTADATLGRQARLIRQKQACRIVFPPMDPVPSPRVLPPINLDLDDITRQYGLGYGTEDLRPTKDSLPILQPYRRPLPLS